MRSAHDLLTLPVLAMCVCVFVRSLRSQQHIMAMDAAEAKQKAIEEQERKRRLNVSSAQQTSHDAQHENIPNHSLSDCCFVLLCYIPLTARRRRLQRAPSGHQTGRIRAAAC